MSVRDVHNLFEGGIVLQTTDAQARKLMREIRKTGKIGDSALRSGMSRNTAAKYARIGKPTSELTEPDNIAVCPIRKEDSRQRIMNIC